MNIHSRTCLPFLRKLITLRTEPCVTCLSPSPQALEQCSLLVGTYKVCWVNGHRTEWTTGDPHRSCVAHLVSSIYGLCFCSLLCLLSSFFKKNGIIFFYFDQISDLFPSSSCAWSSLQLGLFCSSLMSSSKCGQLLTFLWIELSFLWITVTRKWWENIKKQQ